MATITIGKYAITKVVELERPFAPAREFFPDLTAEMLEICQRELPQGQLAPDGWVNMSYHTFLVKTDRYTMLVDTCCGNHKNRTARPEFHQLDTNFLCTLRRGREARGSRLYHVHAPALGPYRLEHA